MTNTSWSETGTTWNNQPAIDGATLGSFGAVSRDSWYELDVRPSCHRQRHVQPRHELDHTRRRLLRLAGERRRRPAARGHHRHTTTAAVAVTRCWSAPATSPTAAPGDEATAALLDGIAGTVFTARRQRLRQRHARPSSPTATTRRWGRHKARTRPAPGNHDYDTAGRAGLLRLLRRRRRAIRARATTATTSAPGTSSSLNSNCIGIGGCGAARPQEQWLRADLAAHPKPCTLAYWHHPLLQLRRDHGRRPSTRAALAGALRLRRRRRRSTATTTTTSASRRRTRAASRDTAARHPRSSSSAPAAPATTASARSSPTARSATATPTAC